jgi:hypoxanthine phosphoribosyltransferase
MTTTTLQPVTPQAYSSSENCRTVKVGLAEVTQKLEAIARQMQQANWQPEQIVGIIKGGAVPATMISHLLGQPTTLYLTPQQVRKHLEQNPETRILVIDDICDSGQTFSLLAQELSAHHRLSALLENTEQKVRLDFSGEKIRRSLQPDWYEFFWEPTPLKAAKVKMETESYPPARELSLTLQMLGSLNDLRDWFMLLCHEPSLVRRQSIFTKAQKIRECFGETGAQAILILGNTRVFEAVRGALIRLEQRP